MPRDKLVKFKNFSGNLEVTRYDLLSIQDLKEPNHIWSKSSDSICDLIGCRNWSDDTTHAWQDLEFGFIWLDAGFFSYLFYVAGDRNQIRVAWTERHETILKYE